jgi:hypothetical protein
MNVSLVIVERHSSLAVMDGVPSATGWGAAFAPSISDRRVHGRSSVSASRRFR